jgi:hypothetical protein
MVVITLALCAFTFAFVYALPTTSPHLGDVDNGGPNEVKFMFFLLVTRIFWNDI